MNLISWLPMMPWSVPSLSPNGITNLLKLEMVLAKRIGIYSIDRDKSWKEKYMLRPSFGIDEF